MPTRFIESADPGVQYPLSEIDEKAAADLGFSKEEIGEMVRIVQSGNAISIRYRGYPWGSEDEGGIVSYLLIAMLSAVVASVLMAVSSTGGGLVFAALAVLFFAATAYGVLGMAVNGWSRLLLRHSTHRYRYSAASEWAQAAGRVRSILPSLDEIGAAETLDGLAEAYPRMVKLAQARTLLSSTGAPADEDLVGFAADMTHALKLVVSKAERRVTKTASALVK